MVAIKYDVSDVEAGGGGVEPQPDLYPGKIVSMTERKKNKSNEAIHDVEIVVDIGSEYVRLWTYVKLPDDPNFENSKWKFRELTDALGLPPKGSFDPKKQDGKPVMVKTKMRRDDPERAEIKNLFKPGSETVKGDEAAALAAGDGEEDYSTWSVEDLTAEIEERGLEVPSGRKSIEKLAQVLIDADATGDEPAAEEEPATEDEAPADEYDEWDSDDLKAELAERGLTVEGRFSQPKAINALREHDASGGGTEAAAEGGEAEAEDDYDDWSDDELKAEIADRKTQGAEIAVTGRWTREKAIAAMREDDEANPF